MVLNDFPFLADNAFWDHGLKHEAPQALRLSNTQEATQKSYDQAI